MLGKCVDWAGRCAWLFLVGTLTGVRRSVWGDEHMSSKARRARVSLFLDVAGLVWTGKPKRGAPRSMSGCEALRDVAEGCVGGCLAEGCWRESGSGTPLNDLSSVAADVCRKASDLPKPVAAQKHQYKPRLPAVNCNALSGFVIMIQSYYYFPLGVSFFKIPESFGNLT